MYLTKFYKENPNHSERFLDSKICDFIVFEKVPNDLNLQNFYGAVQEHLDIRRKLFVYDYSEEMEISE